METRIFAIAVAAGLGVAGIVSLAGCEPEGLAPVARLAAGATPGAAGTAATAAPPPSLAVVMPRLPRDHAFPRRGQSPGAVTFSHASHVDARRADCTTCHPRHFRILAPGQTAAGVPVTHRDMEQGRQCGACHDGKAAFGLKDCETCHSGK
jgi:c(7)-type cytochrome triheme protein